LNARNGPNKAKHNKISEKYEQRPTPKRLTSLLAIGIIINDPRAEKKMAPPILASVIPILSAICGIYVTQVLKTKLKQKNKNAEEKYFLCLMNILNESIEMF